MKVWLHGVDNPGSYIHLLYTIPLGTSVNLYQWKIWQNIVYRYLQKHIENFESIFFKHKENEIFTCGMLQKLTKSAPPERDSILADYLSNDLLGCANDGDYWVSGTPSGSDCRALRNDRKQTYQSVHIQTNPPK